MGTEATYFLISFLRVLTRKRLYSNQFIGFSNEAVDLKVSQGAETTKAPWMLTLGLPTFAA